MKEFVGLKSKLYSFSVDDSSEHKKPNSVNRNVNKKVTHNEYKDVLLRYSINRIQGKSNRIGT